MKADCGPVFFVNKNKALQSADQWWKLKSALIKFASTRDKDAVARDLPAQTLTGALADLIHGQQLDSLSFRCRHDRCRQGVLRILFGAGNQLQNLLPRDPRFTKHVGHRWPAASECAGFVEDERLALFDLFEDYRVLDDNGAASSERDRADDGSGNGKQQGARRGDDDNGEESFRVPLLNAAAIATPSASGVYHAPS